MAADVREVALLTPRQTEVLYLVAMGCANREIAGRLGMSIHTVKQHLTTVYAALGVRGWLEAALAWHRYQREIGG